MKNRKYKKNKERTWGTSFKSMKMSENALKASHIHYSKLVRTFILLLFLLKLKITYIEIIYI